MKTRNLLLALGGLCAAAAGLLVWGPQRRRPVAELAHDLENAWKDHHTTV